MVENFERYTDELTELEAKKILPEVKRILEGRRGKWNAITNKQIVALLGERYLLTTEPRVRKMVHKLRTEGALPWLIATSVGYYLATTLGEMEGYVRSLESRANSIMEVAQAIRKQMDGTLF